MYFGIFFQISYARCSQEKDLTRSKWEPVLDILRAVMYNVSTVFSKYYYLPLNHE